MTGFNLSSKAGRMRCLLALLCICVWFAKAHNGVSSKPPSYLPFPACRAVDLNCLRRGLRTFFFLMEEQHLGMSSVDPTFITSLALAYPDIELRFIMRNLNVTGARWTGLVDRRLNDPVQGINSVVFSNDFHVTSTLLIKLPVRSEFYTTSIVMDIHEIQSNISYQWLIRQNLDGENYVNIGQEQISVLKPRQTTFYLDSDKDEPLLRNVLENRPSTLTYLAQEITNAVMQNVVNNFRIFSHNVPFRFYYKV